MSKNSLVFIVVALSVVLVVLLVFGGVYFERYQRIYKAIMCATNNPDVQVAATPSQLVPTNLASVMVHGVYAAQQLAKKQTARLELPPPMQPVLFTSDAGVVIAVDAQNTLYVLFRGTLFDYEWKQDFDFIQTPLLLGNSISAAQVHKGFQKMYLSYQPHVLKYMSLYKPSKVCVAGHSLGAALTVLTAFDLSVKYSVPVTCFTFAPPKVGNLAFVQAFDALPNVLLTQYVNEADLVPLIPLSVMPNSWVPKKPLFYEHIQQDKMILFNINNKSWQNNHSLVLHMAVVDSV
jgi:predicted lipase